MLLRAKPQEVAGNEMIRPERRLIPPATVVIKQDQEKARRAQDDWIIVASGSLESDVVGQTGRAGVIAGRGAQVSPMV